MSDNQDSTKLQPLPDLRYIRELAKVVKQYALGEIEIETGDSRILLRRGGDGAVTMMPVAAPAPAAAPVAAAAPAAAAPAEVKVKEGDFITSPFVGTYYSAPNPDSEDFVKVGQSVGAGQPVCIVEAMKLFNEIDTEFACTIEEVLVENGQPVEFGAKLFRVKKT